MATELAALRQPGRLDGIDVSSVQTIHDPHAVAEAGFAFATVKVSEGANACDPRALGHLRRLRDVGLVCNVYTFLRPSQGEARAQVRRAYDCAGDEYPCRLALDLEGAPDGMTDVEILAFAEEAIDETRQNGVLLPEIYTYPWFYRQRCLPAFGRSALVGMCPLWIADYGPELRAWAPSPEYAPYTPIPWTRWMKWQYSGDGGFRVPGIAGDVDRDLFAGDLDAFRAYMGLAPAQDADTIPIIHAAPPMRGDDG